MPTRVAVIADTHLSRDHHRVLPDRVRDEIRQADLVLHAGDVTTRELLDDIAAVAPLVAVWGNNDTYLHHLPDRWEETVDGVRVGMIHDTGATKGRPARVHRWFPDADLVIFGHSHVPLDETGVDGQRLLNPGSPTLRRRQPRCSMATLTLDDGTIGVDFIWL